MLKLLNKYKNMLKAAMLALLCICCFSENSYAGKITGLRIGQGIGNVRIVFDADSKFDYKVFTLGEPNRLVIDTQGMEASIDSTNSNFINDTGCI